MDNQDHRNENNSSYSYSYVRDGGNENTTCGQMTTPATVTIRQEAVISIMKHRNKRKNGFMVVALSKKW